MADNLVKDFVKKQARPVSIGVPVKKETGAEEKRFSENEPQAVQPQAVPAAAEAPKKEPKRKGRPKGTVEKTRMSVYLPEDLKKKVELLQHITYKSSTNDVVVEAIMEYCKKHNL